MNKYSFEDLRGKVCVLTGGGGVIGASLAHALGSVGVKVVVADLNLAAAEAIANKVTQETGTPALGVEANVLDRASLEKSLETIHQHFGPVDLLINGAGGNSPKATTKQEKLSTADLSDLKGSFFDLDLEGFRFVFDLNFLGTLLPSMIYTKDMLTTGKGVVLNVSSMNAFRPLTKIPAYSAAKSAINNFTEWLSVHLAETGIRVNAVAPGFFITNQNRFLLIDEQSGDLTPRGQKVISNTPMGKFGEPDHLQGTVLYLLSDLSAFVTGVVIPVDGGFNAYSGV
jgi:NAD(P)-dependent dehydrogenase (short-subunit alcohol dehydrogenase family)